MYARGMTTREIRGHVAEMYGVTVSAELISKVTDAVLEEVAQWQSRPLEEVYAIVYLDAVRVKMRDEGLVRNKAANLLARVPGDRRDLYGTQGGTGAVDRADRRCEVLAERDERAQGARRGGRPDRGRVRSPRVDRPAWLSRCDRGGVSAGDCSDLHRSPHPALAGVRVVQGAQAAGGGAEGDLPDPDGGGRGGSPRCLRGRSVGREVPDDRA